MLLGTPVITDFDRTTAIRPVGRDMFDADLDPTWASLRGVHGGYMAALAVRAAEAMAPDRAVRSVTTSFLRPGSVGPARLEVLTQRMGRTFATLDVALVQDGRTVNVSRITATNDVPGADWASSVTDRPAPLAECVPFTPPPSIRHFGQAELRVDPATVPTGDAADARIAGYVRPLDRRAIDAAWLVMVGDWFPPSPFRRLMPPTGGVSVDYAVHIHRLPGDVDPDGAADWVAGVFDARDSSGAIALERGTLATVDGVALASTFHTRYTGG